MIQSTLACPKCRAELPRLPGYTTGQQRCPSCSKELEFTLFPALDREQPQGEAGELLVVDGEASCFYHTNKRAIVPCVACGRFLCALCDVEVEGRHFCAACFQKGSQAGTTKSLERSRTRYDKIAFSLVTLPVLFWCVMPVTAPAGAFVAMRYWSAPASLVQNSRGRLWVSLILAVIEFFASVAFIYFIYTKRNG